MSKFAIPVVGALVFDENNKLFLMQSSGKFADAWIVPGGKVNHGEKLEAALRREIKEETNLDLNEVKYLGVREMINEKNHFIFIEYSAQVGNDYCVILNEEAIAFRWFTREELKTINIAGPTKELIGERLYFEACLW